MGVIKLVFVILGLILAAGIVFYFAPDTIKEQGLAYISGNSIIPSEVKKVVESIYATPSMKREGLIKELEKNFADIKAAVPESATKIVERTQQILEQVLEQPTPTIIQQITETVTQKLLKSGTACVPSN